MITRRKILPGRVRLVGLGLVTLAVVLAPHSAATTVSPPTTAAVTKILVSVAGPVSAGNAFKVTARALDASGHLVTTYNASATWSDLSTYLTPAPPASFVNGVSTTTTATVSVPFHLDKVTVQSGGLSGTSLAFNVYGPLAHIKVIAPGSTPSGTAFTLKAYAQDNANNTLVSYNSSATWSDLSAHLTPAMPASFVNGVSTTTTAMVSVPFHLDKVTVQSGGFSGTSLAFNVYGPLEHLTVSVPAGPMNVGTHFTVTARAFDAASNLLVGYNASATWSDLSGTLDPSMPADFVSGVSTTANARVNSAQMDDTITVQTGGISKESAGFDVYSPNNAPTDISLSANAIDENQPIGTTIGSLSATDQDSGQTHTFSLVNTCGANDNGSFSITGGTLKSGTSFNYEAKNSYSVCIRTTDNGTPNLSFDKQFTISINDVNDPPAATNDNYLGAIGNTKAQLGVSTSGPVVTLTGNVLTNNDSDEDTTFPHAISAVPETVPSTGGGSATINSDGSFVFTPGVGDKNQNDTFTYHVTDGSLQSAGTVTIHIDNFLVWYADKDLGVNGDGRSNSPFNTLSGINAAGGSGDADGSGDVIFLYSAGANYTGGLPLEVDQQLIGEPNGLTVNAKNLVAAGGSNPTVTNSGGVGIQLANRSKVQGINVSSTTGAGISGSGVTTSSVDTSTSGTITGANGGGVSLSGAAGGNISIGSSIATSSGHSVSVANRSSGTVAFSGAINDTGTGISLSSNTGATVNLTGGVVASTGIKGAFSATGGGTVNVTRSNNTLTTTTGAALSVSSTTIGSKGLNFKSISSNGAANGIALSDTGSSGGLTVTGDGSNTSLGGNGTGGTISNATGADGTTNGIGVYLKNTSSVSLSRMTINGTNQNFGVYGTGVNGLTLQYSTVGGTDGTSTGLDEGSIVFDGLTGTSTFTKVPVSGSIEDNFRIRNSSGTSDVTIDSSTFTNAPNDNLIIEPSGTSTVTAHVTNNTFTGAGGDHFQTSTTSSATLNVVFTGNLYSNGFGGSLLGGVTISGGNLNSSEHVNFNISNNGTVANPLTGNVQGGAINVNEGQGGGTWQGQVSNNIIGSAGVVGSGSTQASGIRVENHSTSGTLTAKIDGNTIRQWGTGAAINTQAGDAGNASNTGVLNVTVTNNTATNPGASTQHGFVANIGAGSGTNAAANVACVDVHTNTLDGNVTNGGAGVRVRQREVSTVHLPGYAGTQYDTSAVAALLQTNNPASVGSATAATSSMGPGYSAVASCPQPTVPS